MRDLYRFEEIWKKPAERYDFEGLGRELLASEEPERLGRFIVNHPIVTSTSFLAYLVDRPILTGALAKKGVLARLHPQVAEVVGQPGTAGVFPGELSLPTNVDPQREAVLRALAFLAQPPRFKDVWQELIAKPLIRPRFVPEPHGKRALQTEEEAPAAAPANPLSKYFARRWAERLAQTSLSPETEPAQMKTETPEPEVPSEGEETHEAPEKVRCPKCGGEGQYVAETSPESIAISGPMKVRCDLCDGTGFVSPAVRAAEEERQRPSVFDRAAYNRKLAERNFRAQIATNIVQGAIWSGLWRR